MIQIEHLSKSFEGRNVLRDVNLTINDGDTVALIGRSGSGKSVLMKHIVGLLRPDEGRVIVDGQDINAISYSELRRVRKQFGVLFQGGALFDSMSVFDNVAFPLRTFTSETEGEIRRRVEECLDRVHLVEAANKKPSEISGGMQKRAALARAIALEPRYIIYDEPTSGLDPETSNSIDMLIRDLDQELGVTGIVVTHDMHSVLSVAERVAFIHEGELRWVGTLEDLHRADDEVLLAFVKANEYQIGKYVPLREGVYEDDEERETGDSR
ncbi:MAG TPA: ATP-binding cassette domain-containing protein [Rhodothermales bacterium]|nr:ATP-binding cassette domain-containing protein [Rhodothermales bacterium]